MTNPGQRVERARTLLHAARGRLRLDAWFPHGPLALLLAVGGLWLLRVEVGADWFAYFDRLVRGDLNMPPHLLLPLLVGGGLVAMAFGLLLRSRVAWIMALLLLAAATASVAAALQRYGVALPLYFLALAAALALAWRRFDRASVAASTLFALTAVAMLMMYATFGSLYFGREFRPPITDWVSALYYAVVTMSTVGYGDFIPQTPQARLFAVSIIVLGMTVFATSLTAVIAPVLGRSLRRIVNRKGTRMKRENHFIVVGNTALAVNTWRELARRGRAVTRILRRMPQEGEPSDVDLVVGDPGDLDVLRQAGAERARAVLAMLDDDSENAFVVLAVKELRGAAQTVAAVNDAHHLNRIRLVQPDVTIAPQVLGGELMAMILSGEPVTGEYVLQRLLQSPAPVPPARR